MKKLYTIEEAADILRIKPGTLRNWVTAKTVEFSKVGGSIRFTEDQLKAMIK